QYLAVNAEHNLGHRRILGFRPRVTRQMAAGQFSSVERTFPCAERWSIRRALRRRSAVTVPEFRKNFKFFGFRLNIPVLSANKGLQRPTGGCQGEHGAVSAPLYEEIEIMLCIAKKGLIGAAAVAVLSTLVFGRDVFSYVKTLGSSTRDAIKAEVPIEFEIQRARDMVGNLVPDIRKCMHVIAEEEVNVEHLSKEIARAQTDMNKQKD